MDLLAAIVFVLLDTREPITLIIPVACDTLAQLPNSTGPTFERDFAVRHSRCTLKIICKHLVFLRVDPKSAFCEVESAVAVKIVVPANQTDGGDTDSNRNVLQDS